MLFVSLLYPNAAHPVCMIDAPEPCPSLNCILTIWLWPNHAAFMYRLEYPFSLLIQRQHPKLTQTVCLFVPEDHSLVGKWDMTSAQMHLEVVYSLEVNRLWFFNADTDLLEDQKKQIPINRQMVFLNFFFFNNDNYNNTEWTYWIRLI